MKRISLVKTAHDLISTKLKSGDIAVDATLGNGHDCLFLAQQVGMTGKVFGFDIQAAAISASQEKCQQANLHTSVTLIQTSHTEMADLIPEDYHGHIKVIMFNLGYLPGGDKTLITQADSTLLALSSAGRLLATSGLMTITAYPGHPGGDLEAEQVKNWCAQLNNEQFSVEVIYSAEDKETAPRLFTVWKKPTFVD